MEAEMEDVKKNLQFLQEIRNLMFSSPGTNHNISEDVDLNASLTSLSETIPSAVISKIFDDLNVLDQIKKYTQLTFDCLVARVQIDRNDVEKLTEIHQQFQAVNDCIFAFCTRDEYAEEIVQNLRDSFKKLLNVFKPSIMKDEEQSSNALMYNFYSRTITEFFKNQHFSNKIFEVILEFLVDVTQRIQAFCKIHPEDSDTSETLIMLEKLNYIFNVVNHMISDHINNIRLVDKRLFNNYKLVLDEILKIDRLPVPIKKCLQREILVVLSL